MDRFSWVQIYKEIASKLLDYENRQQELIDIIKEFQEAGLPTISLKDTGENDKKIPLSEIDPFTFFSNWNRGIKKQKRIEILKILKERLKLNSPIPQDFDGIPVMNNMLSWFFWWEKDRDRKDIPMLWKLCREAVRGEVTADTFNAIITSRGIKYNITMALFWVNPEGYINLDSVNRRYLEKKYKIKSKFRDYEKYMNISSEVRKNTTKPFFELSFDAWKDKQMPEPVIEDMRYWVFQGNPKDYDVVSALKDNELKTWSVKQHKDSIKKGDKVILWVVGNNSGCYSLCTIASDIYNGPDHEPEMKYYTERSKNIPHDRVDINIDLNLSNNPILKKELLNLPEFADFKGGNQGTNFKATKEQYMKIKEKAENSVQYWALLVPDKEKLDFCIDNNLWMMQYHYGVQKKNDVTRNWRIVPKVKQGDRVLLLLAGKSKYFAWGKAIKPRLKSDHTAMYKDVLSKGEHDYDDGIIHYKDVECFYENLNGERLFDNEKWGQRIDVAKWQNIKPDGLLVSGIMNSIKPGYSIRSAIVEIREGFFNGVKSKLGGSSLPLPPLITQLQSKNIILYGPPGTGKTYSTINYALSIIESKNVDSYEQEDRSMLRERFEEYQRNEKVGFVSFHQSFSYEDFIEGIKPVEPEEKDEFLKYRIEDGIFKRMCINSTYAIYRAIQKKNGDLKRIDYDSLYLEFIANLKKLKLGKGSVVFKSKTNKEVHLVEVNKLNNIVLKPKEGARSYLVSKGRLSRLYKAFSKIGEIKNVHDDIREIIGGCNGTFYWTMFNELKRFERKLPKRDLLDEESQEDISYETKKELVADFTPKKYPEDIENYVLIIDEINRGNVANIFGELITLIEPDKRAGMKEALSTTLPYSKTEFAVPPNLHIIGTMNTADRSVEALDTALRRRFTFIEKSTDLSLIQQPSKLKVDLRAILRSINNRIEALLDKDHCIGHSYFMRLEDSETPEEDLKKIFAVRVIPLLEEYFYGDPVKIGMVLGKTFVEKKKYVGNNTLQFAPGFKGELDDFEKKEVYEIKDPLKFDDIELFRTLYEE